MKAETHIRNHPMAASPRRPNNGSSNTAADVGNYEGRWRSACVYAHAWHIALAPSSATQPICAGFRCVSAWVTQRKPPRSYCSRSSTDARCDAQSTDAPSAAPSPPPPSATSPGASDQHAMCMEPIYQDATSPHHRLLASTRHPPSSRNAGLSVRCLDRRSAAGCVGFVALVEVTAWVQATNDTCFCSDVACELATSLRSDVVSGLTTSLASRCVCASM